MIRNIALLSYLPPYMKEYKELQVIFKAEDPEIEAVQENIQEVLNNIFIGTADEYGISRFEKILGIIPSVEDTIESRRQRILFRWNDKSPYTIGYLNEKLRELCGNDYLVELNGYCLTVTVHLNKYGEIANVHKLLCDILPCNIQWEIINNSAAENSINYAECQLVHTVMTIQCETGG